MKKPKLIGRPDLHSETRNWCLDLRSLGKGRQFFRHKSDADAERRRQLTTLERHGREAVGLSQRELLDFITAKNELAEYGKTLSDAVEFYVDHLERVRRCKITVAQLANEVLEAKRKGRTLSKIHRHVETLFQKIPAGLWRAIDC